MKSTSVFTRVVNDASLGVTTYSKAKREECQQNIMYLMQEHIWKDVWSLLFIVICSQEKGTKGAESDHGSRSNSLLADACCYPAVTLIRK